jgi:very-long-chain (3R)-3-hydroxyacyl-CoA dehydratase
MANQSKECSAPAISSQPRTIYLTAYNILFASLWASVFVRAISSAQNGKFELFNATEPYARWIQTASLVEVLHAAFGSFITPPSCAFIENNDRYHQISSQHNRSTSRHPCHSGLDGVVQLPAKHSIFTCLPCLVACLVGGRYNSLPVPRAQYARESIQRLGVASVCLATTSMAIASMANSHSYTMFYPLYPIGIGAEWWLLYRTIAPGAKLSPAIPPFFYFCLLLYIPGTYCSTVSIRAQI